MMGPRREQRERLFHYNFSLESRIRKDHPLRGVLRHVDFSIVRERVSHCYGNNGHRSEDPIVIMKLMFLLFFDDVKSERELMRIVPERLDYLWFLGLDLEDKPPDHSVLSKARARWGQELFEELFVQVVGECVDCGLVSGGKIHMDGSLVDADVSADSIRVGAGELIEQLKRAYGVQERKLELLVDETESKRYYQKKNRELVSRTDPDAAVVKQKRSGSSRARYKHHRAIDDSHGVVTAVETTAGDVEENSRLMPLLRQHERNTGCEVSAVVADSQYGTQDNFAACEQHGIDSHMKDLRSQRRQQVVYDGIFKPDRFRYDDAQDCYWCPDKQRLNRVGKGKGRTIRYKASARVCQQCQLKPHCTRSRFGRTITRHMAQQAIDRARAKSHSPQAIRDRIRRRHLMEGSFADAANNHHFKRARWRRRHNQQIQDYLIAVCQNVRILLGHAPLQPAVAAAGKTQGRVRRFWLQLRFLAGLMPFPRRLAALW